LTLQKPLGRSPIRAHYSTQNRMVHGTITSHLGSSRGSITKLLLLQEPADAGERCCCCCDDEHGQETP
jgi:hypothetical protein